MAHRTRRSAWLSPTDRQVRSPAMRCFSWPHTCRASHHILSSRAALFSTATRAQTRFSQAPKRAAPLACPFWLHLSFAFVLCTLWRGACSPTTVPDIQIRFSEAARITHALMTTAHIHISPRMSALSLLRTQQGLFRACRRRQGHCGLPTTSDIRQQPCGPPRTRETHANTRQDERPIAEVFRVYKHHLCTYTHQLPIPQFSAEFPASPSLSTRQQRSQSLSQPQSFPTIKSPLSSETRDLKSLPFPSIRPHRRRASPAHSQTYGGPLHARASRHNSISTCCSRFSNP
jgi:hypothetical protein